MKTLKRALSTILSLTMCLNMTLTPAAAQLSDVSSGVTAQTATVTSADDNETYTEAFDKTVSRNGYYINVSAPEGVFPDGSKLKVKAVTKAKKLKAVREAALEQLEAEGIDTNGLNVDVHIFDITVKHNGEEIQPDTDNGDVTVSITKKRIAATAGNYSNEGNDNSSIATTANYISEDSEESRDISLLSRISSLFSSNTTEESSSTVTTESSAVVTEHRVFHVLDDDSEISLEPVESEDLSKADGVCFNTEHFSEFADISITSSDGSVVPSIDVTATSPNENGDIEWTVTVNRNDIPSTEYTEGFKVTAVLDNAAFSQPTIHNYIDGSFKSEDASIEVTDFKCENITNYGLIDDKYKLSWSFKFADNTEGAEASFKFRTHVDLMYYISKINVDGDARINPANLSPVKIFDATAKDEKTSLAQMDGSTGDIIVKNHKHWIDATTTYNTATQCIDAAVTVHSNGYELKNFVLYQREFEGRGDYFENPTDFKYYYDGTDITGSLDQYAQNDIDNNTGNWRCTIKEFQKEKDHTFKITYSIKLKDKSNLLQLSHAGLNLIYNIRFGERLLFGPELKSYINFDSAKGSVTLKLDEGYGENGYDTATHTFGWKVKVNGDYGDFIDYMPVIITDSKCELKGLKDFVWRDSTGAEVDVDWNLKNYIPYKDATYTSGNEVPKWLLTLSESEKEVLGIDKDRNAYRLYLFYPIAKNEYTNFANKKSLEFTLITGYTDAQDALWASNNFGGDTVYQRVNMYTARSQCFGDKIEAKSKSNIALAAYEEGEAKSKSDIISATSVDKRTDSDDRSGYNYTDRTITYEVSYNQNRMTMNNVAIHFDMARCDVDGQEKVPAPVTEALPGSYAVKIDGEEIQYLSKTPAEKELAAYRPFYTYSADSGLTFYPKDDIAGKNAKEHKLTFTVHATDGDMLSNAAYSNKTNDIVGRVSITADQIHSDQAKKYAVEYTHDDIKTSSLKIDHNVNGDIVNNATIDYTALVNKNQLSIPDGLKLKLTLTKGQLFNEGTLKLYECTISKNGKEITRSDKPVDASKYTVSCIKNADDTSILTIELPKNSGRKIYEAAFTCNTDLDSKSINVNAELYVKCSGTYEGSDAWEAVSASTEDYIKLGDVPEGWRSGYWYTFKAIDADDTSAGVEGVGFVIKDEDGNIVPATGVNAEVKDNVIITPASGSATVFAMLDSSKTYHVYQVQDGEIKGKNSYVAEDRDYSQTLEIESGRTGPWNSVHSYTFKQVKAAWLTFTQDFSGLNGIEKDDIVNAAKAGISYEIHSPNDGTTQSVKFSELTYNSTTGKYESEPIKLRADSELFTLEQKGTALEGYNYKLGAVTQDSDGTNKNDDMQGETVYLRISSKGTKATADLTNTYDYALELRFYPAGDVRPDISAIQEAVSIDVINQKTKESKLYSLKDFTLSDNGTYLYKRVPVSQGQYILREVDSGIDGYTSQTEYRQGLNGYTAGAETGIINIANGRMTKTSALVSFKDTYSSKNDKLSFSVSDVTDSSAKLNGGATRDLTAVYYTRNDDYKDYTPARLKQAYESKTENNGIFKLEVYSKKSFTISLSSLAASTEYTYYAAADCKDGTVLGDGNGLAKASFTTTGRKLTYLDFMVTHYNDQYYTGDDAKHTATVEPLVKMVDDDTKNKYFDIKEVFYRLKDEKTGEYTGEYYTSVNQAGTYGVYATTKNERDGAEHAEKLWVADFTLNKAELNKSWFTAESKKSYRDAVNDLVKANSNISGYGSLSYKLYDDAALTKEAGANINGYYDAGTYYIGAECTGGDNVNATSKPVSFGALTVAKSDYEIYLGAAKAMHYGDGNKYVLDFATDNGITPDGGYDGRYEYLFSKTIDGEYTEDLNGTGEWYVKVKVFGDKNHNDTLSAPKIIRYEKAKLKVSVDFVKGKAWDGKTDIADKDWGLKFERADSSIPLDKTWDEDLKDLSISGKAAWTSAAAGTKTFNITDIKLVNTNMHSNIDYADLYELDTENLYNQTFGDAKISETLLTKDDFTVSDTNHTYEDDSTSFTAKVEKNAAGSHKSDFEIDYVSYKLKDTETGSYSGHYTVTQAGTYGIFVTTRDEKNGVSRAEELYLGDMTIGKRKDFSKDWISFITPSSYGSEPKEDSGFITVDKNVSGYNDIEVVLYTNAEHTQKADRNADKQYDAGTYYAVATISGGSNFDLSTPVEIEKEIVVNKGYNVIALGRPRPLFYGDKMTDCVTAEAKDKSNGVEYLFSRTNDADSSFEPWNDTDIAPCGTWYVKVKTNETDNYKECISDAEAFELRRVKLAPVISSLDSKKYDETKPDDKTATGSLSLEKVEGSAATYGKFDNDKAALEAGLTYTLTWTSAEAGTNTVDVTDIKLNESFTGRYELTTDKLENQTYSDAMIYADPREFSVTDFSWPDDRSFTYDGAVHTLEVEGKGAAAKFIKDIKVSYKLWNAATSAYNEDYIDEPTQVGTYGIFVTADSTSTYYTGVKDLPLTIEGADVQLVIEPAVNKITVYGLKNVYYGDDMSKVLSFILTDNTATTSLVFSDSEEGTYKTWADIKAADEIKTGTWYVKVKAEATTNYKAAESEVKSFELKAAPVTPEISSLESREWKTGDTSATGTLTLKAGSTAVACGELANDLKAGLKAEGTFNWTSYKAGTDTVNVTGITLSGTHAGLYELSTKELKSKTFTDASGNTAKLTGDDKLKADDFAVSKNTYDYAGDYTSYDATVVPTGDYASSFKVDMVRYKRITKDPETGDETVGDFTDDPTDAGEYAIYVTTKDEAEGLERAKDLRLTDKLVINQVNLKDEWVLSESSINYGSKEALAEPDFIISGYGTFETKLYTAYDLDDPSERKEVQKDETGNYPVGSYTLVASVKGGNNIAASSIVLSDNFTVEKAENVVTLSTPKVIMYYGDDMNTVVKVTAKYGADTAELVFARSASEEFAAWDDNNTNPSGIWYVKAKIAETDSYKEAESKAVAFRILKAPLNVTVSELDSKTYDGTTDATGMLSLEKVEGTAASYGRLDADIEAGLSASGTFAWTSAAAGTDTVNVTDIKLTEAFAGRYELKVTHLDGVSYGDAKINKKAEPTPAPKPSYGRKDRNDKTSSSSGSWVKDEKGWRYLLASGSYVKGTGILNRQGSYSEQIVWYSVNGKSYAFGQDGYLQSGWVYNAADGNWYYCDENNGKQSGWHLDASDSCWYYLDPNTGTMKTGWQLINGKWYFFAGVPQTATWSFDETGDKWIYNNTDGSRPYGSLYTDTLTPDNFRVGAGGVWVQ